MELNGGSTQGGVEQLALLAGDETVRQRVTEVIEATSHELVASVESIDELLDVVAATRLSLVIVAWELEPFVPPNRLVTLRRALSGIPLLVVVQGFAGVGARKILRAGAEGLVMERDIESALAPTIDIVLMEHLCVPSAMREEIARPVFSHREKQILELLVQGCTNSDIAGRLYLSESTVKSHLASSFRKLGVSSRGQAVQRLLDPDSGTGISQLAEAGSTIR